MLFLLYKLCLNIALVLFCISIGIACPQIQVIGKHQEKDAEQMVKYYADLLELGSHISIVVSYHTDLPKGVAGYTLFKSIEGNHPIMQVYIKIDIEQSANAKMITLAHEMIHVKQFVKGELVHCGHNAYRWNGKIYRHIHEIPYKQRQWEREALKKQYALSKQYRRHKAHLEAQLYPMVLSTE